MRIVCVQAWSLTGATIVRSVSIDMASDLGEEMDTETEISGDIRDLLPRDGSVNAYGSHLAEMKVNRTKMMVRHVVKLVKFKWCVLRIFFKLSSKMFFVLCNSNTGH